MSLFELLPDIYVPTFAIRVAGRPLEPDVAKRVIQVSVTQRIDPPDHFSFQLHDPNLELIDASGGPLTEGAQIEIHLGYVNRTRKLIAGKISSLTADFPNSGPPTLQVDGFDALHDLTRGTTYRKFEGSTPGSGPPDSQIVSDIASEVGLDVALDTTLERRDVRVQNHVTNLAFLEELASANGYLLWVEDGKLHFARERSTPSTLRLAWGRTLLSFSPRLSTAGQVNAVEVRGWDPVQNQSYSARVERSGAAGDLAATGQRQLARGAGGRSEIVVEDVPVSSAKEAEAVAKRLLDEQEQALVTGSGTTVGHPDLRVGCVLELSGIGRFDGRYRVTQATHTVSQQGYLTSFQVNGGAPGAGEGFTGAGRARGSVQGVMPGVVTDTKDPDRRGRIKVKLPALSDDTEHWARVATLMAGPERGTFFLPDKKDEVLVAFERGDVARPYVLGALWNGRDKQPDANADGENNLRFIKSRRGHLIRLDDTEGAEKIEIVDRSGNNRVVIDTASNTTTIRSDKDIVVEAPQGTISLNAKAVAIKTTAGVTVEAASTLDLQADGATTLKGATVDIN